MATFPPRRKATGSSPIPDRAAGTTQDAGHPGDDAAPRTRTRPSARGDATADRRVHRRDVRGDHRRRRGGHSPGARHQHKHVRYYHHARLDRRERRDRHALGARHQRGRGGRAGLTRDRRPRRGEDGTDRERHRRVQGHVQLIDHEAGARPGDGVLRGGGGGLHPRGRSRDDKERLLRQDHRGRYPARARDPHPEL